jgi:hypothetical protein
MILSALFIGLVYAATVTLPPNPSGEEDGGLFSFYIEQILGITDIPSYT